MYIPRLHNICVCPTQLHVYVEISIMPFSMTHRIAAAEKQRYMYIHCAFYVKDVRAYTLITHTYMYMKIHA